jgi:hypothetical protein
MGLISARRQAAEHPSLRQHLFTMVKEEPGGKGAAKFAKLPPEIESDPKEFP